jgi:hypothetical protein
VILTPKLIYINKNRKNPCRRIIIVKTNYLQRYSLLYFIIITLLLFLTKYLIYRSGDIELDPGDKCVQNKKLNMCHLNIRSILTPGRLDDLSDFVQDLNDFDIVALSETHLDPSIPNSDLYLENYNLFRLDRNRLGGGVAIYIKNNFSCKRRLDLEHPRTESIWVELLFNNHKLLISSNYRKPNQNADDVLLFLNNLQDSVDKATDDNSYATILLGDFNDRCKSWHTNHEHSELKNKLKDLLSLNNLKQLIDDPTREDNLLDLIITDAPNYFLNSGVIPSLPNLDHDAVFGTLKFAYRNSGSYTRHLWLYDRANFVELNNKLSNVTWKTVINNEEDLNEAVHYMTSEILLHAKSTIPNKTVKIRRKDKPWFTYELRTIFRERDRLHKLKNRTKNPRHIDYYKSKRNEATAALRDAKRNYYIKMSERIMDPKTSSKNYWKLVKNCLGNKQSSSIPSMMENDLLIDEDTDKAELLNNYFAAQAQTPISNTPLPPFSYLTESRLSDINITPHSVKQVLLSLDISKATGPDNISNKILKECADSLSKPLTHIFNRSINLGIFPDSWKEAMVTAIFKKLNKQHKENYRPISLLSCISKIFERLIFNKTYQHMRDNKLLNENNSGFQKDDSAILRLLSLCEAIYNELDKSHEMLLLFLDISKAFDKVWHPGLLFKLRQSGVDNSLLRWFESYLSKRRQRVVVGGKSSQLLTLNAGVPQGSILGPLLFLIFIADLSSNLENPSSLFADDTTVIREIDSEPVLCIVSANKDLSSVLTWADIYRITFNPTKTVYLRISLKHNQIALNQITMGGVPIPEVDTHINLGLMLSNTMDWQAHINKIIQKVSYKLSNLKRLQYKLPRSTLECIYLTMIRPIIEYSDIVYDNLTINQSDQLENIQRRAAIICTGAYRHTDHRSLLHELGWERLSSRRKAHRLIAYYKLYYGPTPAHIVPLMGLPVSEHTQYNLRNKQNIRTPQTRLEKSRRSFFPQTITDWNNQGFSNSILLQT